CIFHVYVIPCFQVLVLAAAQQQQSQWQSGAATSSTTNNNDNDNGLSTILMKKMRPTTEWLLNNNVTRDYLGASVCSLVLTPFLTMEFLEQACRRHLPRPVPIRHLRRVGGTDGGIFDGGT
ncbi:hypothetical protein Vafri_17445, partial [Volvox africanus]